MVESIAATSLLGHRPILGHHPKAHSGKRLLMNPNPNRLPNVRFSVTFPSIKSQAMELTKEVYNYREEDRMDVNPDHRKPASWPPKNKADNPSLHNPLLRQERMGSGWLGVIFEWEGVLIEDNPDLENQAWIALSQEESKSRPPAFLLRRIEGMKNEQAISEVLCWTRDPTQLTRMSTRKESIHKKLQGGIHRFRDGSHEFVSVLTRYNIPIALVSTRPRKNILEAIESVNGSFDFDVIVSAEDVYRGKPDPEMFEYAARLLRFIPERCIVFGNSNLTIEAAHDARMKCVAVASKHPVYELGAADLVVRRLDELSVVDLKRLAAVESGEVEPEAEMEAEDDDRASNVAVDDGFW